MRMLLFASLAAVLIMLGMVRVGPSEQPTPLKTPAPELAEVTAWINTEPLTLAQLKGKVVVVHFFAFG